MKRNWIFDWSGTLVDDMALVVDATNHVLRIYGADELDRESFRRSFRLPYEEFYAECLPGVALEELEGHFREGFAISGAVVPILPFAREFLDFLKERGERMFVLTSMCSIAFSEQLEELGLGDYFEATYSGVLDKREVIGGILSDHELVQGETVFVGDMTHDVLTAHHGGIGSVGVLTGYNHREVLESSKPNLLLANLGELRDVIDGGQAW